MLTINTAKLGQRVKLLKSQYTDSWYNPVWGGKNGNILGTVTGTFSPFIRVKWDNGPINHYIDNELSEHVENAVPAVQPVSLQDAVTAVVTKEFVSQNKEFSAFDVTSKLRREVNEGRIVIENRAKEDVNGVTTQRINHDEVRVAVRDIMDVNTAYDRVFNTTYFIFKPNGSTASATPSASAPSARPVVVIGAAATPAIGTLNYKVKTYIQRNGERTLKQVQSRLKCSGAQPTVRQIGDAAMSAGLTLTVKSPYYASTVR